MAQELSENNIELNNRETQNGIDLGELLYKTLQILKSFFFVVAALGFVGAAAAGIISYKRYTPKYSSQAVFAVKVSYGTAGESYNQVVAKQMALTFPHILSSSSLEKLMEKDLNTDKLPGKMTAEAMGETNMFSLTVTSSDPEDAYNMIPSAVNRYPDIAEYIIGKSELTMVIPPELPTSPVNSPRTAFYAGIGFIAGIVIGLIGAVVAAIFSTKVVSTDNIEEDIGCKSLGAVPFVRTQKKRGAKSNASLTLLDNISQNGYNDSVRFVCGAAIQQIKKAEMKTVMVTSSFKSEGKTTFSVNLAVSLARKGYKTVLIDCDRRAPSVVKTIKINSEIIKTGNDLIAVLGGSCKTEDALVRVGSSRLFVLPIFKAFEDASDVVESERLGELISELEKSYDYVIIDTAPTGLFSDAKQIARFCDGMVYVIKQNSVKSSVVINNIRSFSDTGIELVGAVLSMSPGGSGGVSYGLGYGKYGYGKYGYGKYGYGKYGGKYGYGGYGYRSEKQADSVRPDAKEEDAGAQA